VHEGTSAADGGAAMTAASLAVSHWSWVVAALEEDGLVLALLRCRDRSIIGMNTMLPRLSDHAGSLLLQHGAACLTGAATDAAAPARSGTRAALCRGRACGRGPRPAAEVAGGRPVLAGGVRAGCAAGRPGRHSRKAVRRGPRAPAQGRGAPHGRGEQLPRAARRAVPRHGAELSAQLNARSRSGRARANASR